MNIIKFKNIKDYSKGVIYEIEGQDTESSELTGFSKINIFIGTNNSGKSNFLRKIMKEKDNQAYLFDSVHDFFKNISQEYEATFRSHIYSNFYILSLPHYHSDKPKIFNDFIDFMEGGEFDNASLDGESTLSDFNKYIKNSFLKLGIYKKINDPTQDVDEINSSGELIYIPILRGLRGLPDDKDSNDNDNNNENVLKSQDFFEQRTKIDYDVTNKIFSGLGLYKEIRSMLLGSEEGRNDIKDFEIFLSKNFFQDKQVTIVPMEDSDVLHVKIGESKDIPIYNLGDGIQSIIINTFQAFKNKDKKTTLFIEEPELLMHPSMQRVFVKTLIENFPNLQVFLTTHSNHFIDLTYDYPDNVSIFSFEEDGYLDSGQTKIKIKNVTDNSRIIDLLGVRNSSVFLSNCVVWTEGVTDRMFFRKMMEFNDEFSKKFIEDKHYSFAEYGGSNLSNFNFGKNIQNDNQVNIESISKRNFLFSDNDGRSVNNLKEGIRKVKDVLGKDSVCHNYVELENLVPFRVWVEVIKDYGKNRRYSFVKGYDGENVEKLFNKDIKKEKIGEVLKKHLIKHESKVNYSSENSVLCLGGTKKDIMECILKHIDILKSCEEYPLELKNFPSQTKSALKKLEAFIKAANN